MELEKQQDQPQDENCCWHYLFCVPEDVAGSEKEMAFDEALETIDLADRTEC